MMPPPNPSALSQTENVIKKTFNKYGDLEEQKYSEKCLLALKIMDILFRTEQCQEQEYQKIKNLILYTKDNLSVSVFQLDLMVSPTDRLPYNEAKNHKKVFIQYEDEGRTKYQERKYALSDVQELMLCTMHEINKILHEVLIRARLLNYYD